MPRFFGIVRRARLDEAIAQRDHYRALFEGANVERDEAVARLSGAREAIARHHSSVDAIAAERDEARAKLAAAEKELCDYRSCYPKMVALRDETLDELAAVKAENERLRAENERLAEQFEAMRTISLCRQKRLDAIISQLRPLNQAAGITADDLT